MKGSLLQLYYNTNITLKSNVSDITFFRSVYLKYLNFIIDTTINNSINTCNYGEENEIIINNYGNYISNLTFKIDIASLETNYKVDKNNYKFNLLKSNNLNIYYNLQLSKNNLNLLNNILNIHNDNFIYLFINDNTILQLNINNNTIHTNYFSQYSISNNLLFFTNNIEEYKENKFVNQYLINYYNNNYNNKYNNNNIFILYNIIYKYIFNSQVNILYNSCYKILLKYYYININNSNSILALLVNKLKDLYIYTSTNKLLNNNIANIYFLENTNYNKDNKEVFNTYNNNINIIVSHTTNLNTNDYIIINNNRLIVANIINITNNNLTINLFENDLTIHDDYTNTKLIIDSTNIINYTNFIISKVNTHTKQYKIVLQNITIDDIIINSYIYLIKTNIKTIYYITNILYYNNNIVLYCTLYNNDNITLINNLNFIKLELNSTINILNSNQINDNKIININYVISDVVKTYNYNFNNNLNYLSNISNIKYQQIINNSVYNSLKFNPVFLYNIINNIFINNAIIESDYDYNINNIKINILSDSILDNLLIQIFTVNSSLLLNITSDDNTFQYKNEVDKSIIPYYDIIVNSVNKYKYTINTLFSSLIQNIFEIDTTYFDTIKKEIDYVKTTNIQITLILEGIYIISSSPVYIFNNLTNQVACICDFVSYTSATNTLIVNITNFSQDQIDIKSNYTVSNNSSYSSYPTIVSYTTNIFNISSLNTHTSSLSEPYNIKYYYLIYLIHIYQEFINTNTIDADKDTYTSIFLNHYYHIKNYLDNNLSFTFNSNTKLYSSIDFQKVFTNDNILNELERQLTTNNKIYNIYHKILLNKQFIHNNKLIIYNDTYNLMESIIYFKSYLNYTLNTYINIINTYFIDEDTINKKLLNSLVLKLDYNIIGYNLYDILSSLNNLTQNTFNINEKLLPDSTKSTINSDIVSYITEIINKLTIYTNNNNTIKKVIKYYNKIVYQSVDKTNNTFLYNDVVPLIDDLKINISDESDVQLFLDDIKDNEYDVIRFNNIFSTTITSVYNIFKLIYIINESLFTNTYKNIYIKKNNILYILNKQFTNLNLYTSDNIENYYLTNINDNDLKIKLITFNSNNYIIFNKELYYTDSTIFYTMNYDEILTTLNLIKNSNNKQQLIDIENIKYTLPKSYYSYKSANINTEIIDINNLINTVNGVKYFFYKNCILTEEEYNLIKLNKFEILQITEVDNLGAIINYSLNINLQASSRQQYTNINKFCLSYGNGNNAYGTIELDDNNYIKTLTFTNTGINFIKDEYVIIDIYELPNTITFIPNSNYKFIRRKTDLPFEIEYNYTNDTISRRIDPEYYYLMNQIINHISYIYTHNDTTINNILNISGSIKSISKSENTFYKNDININNKIPDYNYTIIELDNNINFNFIEISNTSNYNGIYLLIPTSIKNKYKILKPFIASESTGTYSSGLSILYNNTLLNKLINYQLLNINQITNQQRFLNKFINTDFLTNIPSVVNYHYNLNNNILINIANFNIFKIDIDNNVKINNKLIPGFPFNTNDNNYFIIKNNVIDYVNIFNSSLQLSDYDSEYQRIYNLIKIIYDNEQILINNYINIEDKLNNNNLNNYIINNKSNSSWIKNLGYNILEYCDLYINNIKIQTIDRDYIYIDSILNINSNNISKYNNLLGITTNLTTYSTLIKPSFTIYIKIPFWFNTHNNIFFPLELFNNSQIKIKYKINNLNNLINIEENSIIKNIPYIDIKAITDIIHLQNTKINYNTEFLYTYIQIIEHKFNKFNNSNDIKLNFINNIDKLIFVIKLDNSKYNKYIDITQIINKIEFLHENIVIHTYSSSELNTLNLFKLGYSIYNETNINIIPFKLNINNFQPSGSFNFSILQKTYLKFYFIDETKRSNYNLLIYGNTFNIIKTLSGIGNKIFNN
tara:strand:- start:29191 stop:34899 length:5709 start_codon:yes stop_codon:yes gene_type:complete